MFSLSPHMVERATDFSGTSFHKGTKPVHKDSALVTEFASKFPHIED